MKLSVEREALLGAVEHATRIVARGTTIPILKHGLLSAADNRIRIKATNLDIIAETSLPAQVDLSGEISLPIAALNDLAKRHRKGAVLSLEVGATGLVALSSGRSKATLPTLGVEDFPSFDQPSEARELVVPGSDLFKLLSMTMTTADEAEQRMFMRGVGIHVAPGGACLRSVATDGARLIRVRVPAPLGADAWEMITVPVTAARELAAMAQERSESPIKLCASESILRAESQDTIITTKLVDTQWPDYERIIPKSFDSRIVAGADEIGLALKRAMVAATDKTRSVALSLSDGTVTLSSRTHDGLSVTEAVDVEVEGEQSLSAQINAAYAGAAIDALKSDRVQIGYSGERQTFVFQRPGDEDVLALVMALRA